MADFLLNDKAELALVAISKQPISDAGFDPSIVVAGKAYNQKTLPAVIFESSGDGDEDPKLSGNFWLNVQAIIKGSAFLSDDSNEDPKVSDELLVRTVFRVLQVDNLPQLLSDAVSDFFVFPTAITIGAPQRSQDESGIWVDSIPMRIYCCGTDLT